MNGNTTNNVSQHKNDLAQWAEEEAQRQHIHALYSAGAITESEYIDRMHYNRLEA